jgi:hypothetical protein
MVQETELFAVDDEHVSGNYIRQLAKVSPQLQRNWFHQAGFDVNMGLRSGGSFVGGASRRSEVAFISVFDQICINVRL